MKLTVSFWDVDNNPIDTGSLDAGSNGSTLTGVDSVYWSHLFNGSNSYTYSGATELSYIKLYIEFSTTGTIVGSSPAPDYFHWARILPQGDPFTCTVSVNTEAPYSVEKGMLVFDALENCLRMTTGFSFPLDSDFFGTDGCGYYNILTNGARLRGLDIPITASFSNMFKSLTAIFGLGYGVEGAKVKVELWEHFYVDLEMVDLNEVGDYSEEVIGEEIFNQITVGFRH